jgi:NAD(P)-dependent dehydrogenase (short-subunit alcohol dehydrogenase family)
LINESLKDQVAIVTGGYSGIGKAIVSELLEANMKVVLVDNKIENDESELGTQQQNQNLAFMNFNLLDTHLLEDIIEYSDKKFGRLDLLVNCAGMYPSSPALKIPETEWDHVMDLNLKAPFFLSKAFAKYLIRNNNGGTIINLASTAASMPRSGISHYATSKAGLVMLTRVLALEWASANIRVNAICPGVVKTNTLMSSLKTEELQKEHEEKISKIPFAREASPNEIAKSVLYLANNEYSGYITGQSIYIDGGYTSGQVFTSFNPGFE